MADINYGMGQYRSNYSNGYFDNNITLEKSYSILVENSYYRDLILKLNGDNKFTVNQSYFLSLTLPKSSTYPLTIIIKLITSGNLNKYQQIRQIIIPSVSNNRKTSDVALYKYNEQIYAGIVQENKANVTGNDIYYQDIENIRKYYRNSTNEQNEAEEITDYYIVTLPHLFNKENDIGTVNFNFIFTPRIEDFNTIVLEILRNDSIEQNYSYEKNDEEYKGFYIDSEKVEATLKPLKNLLGKTNYISKTELNHIGIWGHPDLMLNINGEEIHIGQTGFYELNDYEITSLGVAATENDGNFTIDYQYEV